MTGGARAGKSSLAVRLASASGLPVTFVATAEALDDEMKQRVARHRAERPKGWQTVEEPLALGTALDAIDPDQAVIVDCLTLWVSNVLLSDLGDDEIVNRAARAAEAAAERTTPTFVVTNEVGSGVHPSTDLGRRFRDLLGRVNITWATVAGEAFLVVAGRPLRLGTVDDG